jgi:cell division protein FtsW
MGIYLFFLVRCIKIITRSTRTFAALLTVGISVSLVMQAMLNIAVSVDLVPVTGLNLPIVSKGGTSALFNFLAIGMVLSVSHFSELQRKKDEEEQEQNSNSEESIQSPTTPSYESYD